MPLTEASRSIFGKNIKTPTEITNIENISIFLLLLGIGALFGNLVGGYLTDRIGAPTTLKLSLFGFAILLAAFSLLTLLNPSTLAIVLVGLISLLWGIPGFGMNPALNAYLISLNPKQASMILSFSASALYMGIGLGAFLGGGVISLISINYAGISSGVLVYTNRCRGIIYINPIYLWV